MTARITGLALLGIGATVAVLVHAAPTMGQFDADSEAPIEITADNMEWFHDEQIAIARGNADAVQGRYTLSADVLTAHMTEAADGTTNQISRLDAEGSVVLTTPEETASGRSGTYDVEQKIAVLVGSVVLTQMDNVLRGERLVMDLRTGRSRLEGGPPVNAETTGDGRVRAIFTPGDPAQ
ncbi:MAG: LptA/OstA family protein [Alphaproteobacteria bacterium]|jgi:lipopolysaccharide export system protein LptA|nr:LptA/OstA family protein [Alphaproteobacteria bacterium]